MAAPADEFERAAKRYKPSPPQYLGQGTTTRALGETPSLASEPEFWTLQVDSLRADGASTRRCDARSGTYSDNAWYEIDIPYGWIPAEIANLAVTVADLSVTPFRAADVTFSPALPWAFNTNTPTYASVVANNPAANPGFLPYYARSGTLAANEAAPAVSFMDAGCYLAMQVRGSSRGLPHFLSSLKDDFVSLGGWPLTNGNDTAPPYYADPSMTSPVVQISNPSGGTIRFEQRLAASNAMPSIQGSSNSAADFQATISNLGVFTVTSGATPASGTIFRGTIGANDRTFTVNTVLSGTTFNVVEVYTDGTQASAITFEVRTTITALGWPAWRVVLRLTPIRAVQYGSVAVAPEGQFVG